MVRSSGGAPRSCGTLPCPLRNFAPRRRGALRDVARWVRPDWHATFGPRCRAPGQEPPPISARSRRLRAACRLQPGCVPRSECQSRVGNDFFAVPSQAETASVIHCRQSTAGFPITRLVEPNPLSLFRRRRAPFQLWTALRNRAAHRSSRLNDQANAHRRDARGGNPRRRAGR
jgi:hypothetical protein